MFFVIILTFFAFYLQDSDLFIIFAYKIGN